MQLRAPNKAAHVLQCEKHCQPATVQELQAGVHNNLQQGAEVAPSEAPVMLHDIVEGAWLCETEKDAHLVCSDGVTCRVNEQPEWAGEASTK